MSAYLNKGSLDSIDAGRTIFQHGLLRGSIHTKLIVRILLYELPALCSSASGIVGNGPKHIVLVFILV
jgi:hypothetical protein